MRVATALGIRLRMLGAGRHAEIPAVRHLAVVDLDVPFDSGQYDRCGQRHPRAFSGHWQSPIDCGGPKPGKRRLFLFLQLGEEVTINLIKYKINRDMKMRDWLLILAKISTPPRTYST